MAALAVQYLADTTARERSSSNQNLLRVLLREEGQAFPIA